MNKVYIKMGKARISLFVLLGMFLLLAMPLVASAEWDNSVVYSNNDLTATIKNIWGLPIIGSDLGTLELKSHKTINEVRQVLPGQRVVMWYDFSFQEIYYNGLEGVYFTDEKTGRKIEIDFYYVQAIYGNKPYIIQECKDVWNDRWKSFTKDCSIKESGNYSDIIGWERYNTLDIPKRNVTIGIMVDVKEGDYIDGVWKIAGMNIDKHASWTSGFNNGLNVFWTFNDSNGGTNIRDVVFSKNNLTTNDTISWKKGIINGTREHDGVGDYEWVNNPTFNITQTTNWTISFWANMTSRTNYDSLFATGHPSGADYKYLQISTGTLGGKLSFEVSEDCASWVGGDAQFTTGFTEDSTWHHLVLRKENNNYSFWDNDVNYYSALGVVGGVPCFGGDEIYIAETLSNSALYYFIGSIDELGIWNRSLSSSEISDLYNSGTGITYKGTFEKINVNPSHPINYYNATGTNYICRNSSEICYPELADKSIVGWWTFNLNNNSKSKTFDYSGKDNDGTLNGGVLWNSSGGINETGAYQFDGVNDYISSSYNFQNGTSISISIWIKNNTNPSTFRGILGIGYLSSLQGGIDIGFNGNSNYFRTTIRNFTTGDELSNIYFINNSMFNYVLTYNSLTGNATQYRNGISIFSETSNINITFRNNNILIGMRDISSNLFNGTIDEVMFINRTLTQAEITALYNSQLPTYASNSNRVNIGCNYTASTGNISSVGLNVYDMIGRLAYSNSDTGLSNVSYNRTWAVSALTDSYYNWTCNATGSTGVYDYSSNRSFLVHYTSPQINIIIANNTIFNQTANNINITANITSQTPISNVSLYVLNNTLLEWNEFDGVNDYMEVGSININQTNMSFCFWIKPMEIRGTAQYPLGKYPGTYPEYSFYLANVSNKLNMRWMTRNSTATFTIYDNDEIVLNTWSFICSIYDYSAKTQTLYVNTISGAVGTSAGGDLSNPFQLTVGARRYDQGFFNGTIDEVMIFNKSLSATEITALYNLNRTQDISSINKTGLILYAPMDKYHKEYSGLNNHGTCPAGSCPLYNYSGVYNITTASYSGNLFSVIFGAVINFAEGVYNYFFEAIDIYGNQNRSSTYKMDVDYVPLIDWGNGIANDYANTTNTWIFANVTLTESNFKNITFTLYNSTGLYNFQTYNTPILSYNWTSVPDGNYTYNVSVFDNNENFNSTTTKHIFLDDTAPLITWVEPIGSLGGKVSPYQLTINFTATDNLIGMQYCGYNSTFNSTITTIVCNDISVINVTSTGFNNIIYAYANDSLGNMNITSTEFTINYIENYRNYTQTITAGVVDNIKINFTYYFSGINVILHYNNTNYTMSTSDSGTTRQYNYNLLVPSVSTQTNKTFNFIFLLSNSTGVMQILTSYSNQTIIPLLIDNCTTNTMKIFDLSMKDEESLSDKSGTIELLLDFYTFGTNSLVATYNSSFGYTAGTPVQVCIQNITNSYSTDYKIRYYINDTYYTRYKNIQNMTLSPTSVNQSIILYNLLKSSGYTFKIIVVGNIQTSNGNKDLLVDVQKEYVSKNAFYSVESSITDNGGTAYASLVPTSAVYNFLVSYNGRLLGTFNNYMVKCDNVLTGQCSITLNLASATGTSTNFDNYGDINIVILKDNTTLYNSFTSTDGQSHDVRSLILKSDAYANETICDNTISGTSGTTTCNFPVIYQDTNFMVQTFSDNLFIGTKFFTQGEDAEWYGIDIFIMLLMFSAIVLLMVGHPITIMIGAVLGLTMPVVFLYMVGFSFGAIMGSVIYYIILGGIGLVILKNKI